MNRTEKTALGEEIIRMTDRPMAHLAGLVKMKGDALLDEFEAVQAEYLRVPAWDMFGENRPLWKIDPQEAWDRDAEATEAQRLANLSRP